MSRPGGGGVNWRAVGLGWIVAVAAGVLMTPLLRFLWGLVAAPFERGEFTASAVVVALISGFAAYVAGGYVAGRLAGRSGALNGAMTAVFGLIVGVVLGAILAVVGVVFAEGVAVPPVSFGLAGVALAAGLVLFVLNLLGGYLGGRMAES